MNNIVNRRRTYTTNDKIVLPEGYELGSYFNITGNTKASGFSNMPFDIEIKIAPSVLSGMIYGSTTGFSLRIDSTGKAYCKTGLNSKTLSDNKMFSADVDALVFSHFAMNNQATYFVDGIDTGLKGSVSSSGGMFFASTSTGAQQYKGKVYYIKVYKDDKLFAHFVPVKSSTNSTMYDIVRKVFMTFEIKNAVTVI